MSTEIKPVITLEDVYKLDIRVGRITNVDAIPKTKKMLKLTVEFGEGIGTKTVVSGIGDHFGADDLIGTYLPFVMNLEPREIRGIVSEAMIVMAENSGGNLRFLEANCKEGSVVF